MNWLHTIMDYAGAGLFVVSLFALRQTVMAVIQGGKDSFSLFRNLQDRDQISRTDELGIYKRAILTTFKRFKGPERKGGTAAFGTGSTNELKLVKDVKKYWKAEQRVDYDGILYGVRAVGWGRLTMAAALGAFFCRLLALILKPFVS